MKKIFNPDTAIIEYKGAYTIAQLCTIYTEDDAVVTLCEPMLMPDYGQQVLINNYYLFGGDLYKCRQTHNRTEHDPLTIPALFSFYRINFQDLKWIIGEQVEVGWERIYNDIAYQVIQAHQTQSDWTPNVTPALWKSIDQRPSLNNEWKVGVAYKIGNLVTYLGKTYKCLQAHTSIQTWNPVAAASLWQLQS